jgi:restriction system protein
MSNYVRDDVLAAYELLLEQLDAVMVQINRQGSAAFVASDHERARQLLGQVDELRQLRVRVQALQSELAKLAQPQPTKKDVSRSSAKTKSIVRPTTQPSEQKPTYYTIYRPLVLRALVDLGGRAPIRTVLDRVHQAILASLKDEDYTPWPSDPRRPRWESRVRMCAVQLRSKRFMKPNPSESEWEISEAGREEAAKERA